MGRRKKHEDHVNHEAWAIPYGDLITLLLAFFVVMYAISSVNEGKYRVLSESLVAAFRGAPKSIKPIQIGDNKASTAGEGQLDGEQRSISDPRLMQLPRESLDTRPNAPTRAQELDARAREAEARASELEARLTVMADEIRQAMSDLIEMDLVRVRQTPFWLQVEVKTDILFPTGVAEISESARPTLRRLADILQPFPNPVRVEGHTDNVPIRTNRFPSNWELSAGRAASVVRLFEDAGIDPIRLAAIGLGEHRPVGDNETREGRNRNRRVVIVILANEQLPEQFADDGSEAGKAQNQEQGAPSSGAEGAL